MNEKEVNLTNILPQYNNSKSIQLLLTSEMLLENAAQILLSKNGKDDLLATENIPEAVRTIVSSCSYQRTLEDLKDRMQQQLSTAAPEDIRQLTFMLNQPLRTTEILDCERDVVICSTSCVKMQSGSTEQEQHEKLHGCRGRTPSPTESPTHSSSSSEGSSGTLCATRSTYRAKSPNVLAREINQINITGGMQHSVPIQQTIPLHEHTALRDRFAKTHQVTQSFSDAESSFSSCLNQDSGTVLNQDLLVAMASALDKRKSSLSIRQQTLRQLVHLPIIDVQACEAWTSSMRPDLTNVPVSDTWESVWSSEARLEEKPKSSGTGKVHIVSTTTEVGKRTENKQNLQFYQTGDLRDSKSQTCSFNAGLRDGLADALNDEDETLWSLALRYISKGLSNTPPNIRENYMLLIEHVERLFTVRLKKFPLFRDGLDLNAYPVNRAIRACNLMYQFYRTIPYYWIRYSEKFLNDLIDRCLFVLSLSCPEAWNPTDETYRITPICITSLLDPQADWFTKWMHGAYSRDPLICHFQKNPKLLNFSLQVFLSYLERTSTQPCTIHHKRQASRSTSDNSSIDLSPYYSSIELEYALFLHSTNLIYRVLCHVRGRALFNNRWIPCSTQNRTPSCETTCVKQLVCAMLNYLQMDNNYASGSRSATHPVEIVAHYLSELAANSGCCSDCFGDVSQPDVGIVNDHASIAAGKRKTFTHPVDILLSELRSLCDKQTDKSSCDASRTKLDLQLRILRNLVSHKEGRRLMQLPRINEAGLSTRPVEVICRIADHALAVLNKSTLSQKEMPRSIAQLVHLLEIAQMIQAIPETTELWEPDPLYNLVVQACELMKSCFTGDTKLRHLQKFSSSCWHKLKSIRLKLAQTTHGVAHLYKSGQLEECAQDLACWIAKPTSAINKRPLGFIVSQLACTTEGFTTLKSTGLCQKQLKHAWYCVETGESSGFDDEARSLRPSSWPVDPVDKVVFKAFIWLIRWTASFIALREFLHEQPVTSQTEDDKRRGSPVCLQDFLTRSVLACQQDGVRSLYNQEQTQLLGMRLLSCIISDLDSFLTLECRYHLVDAILQAQVDGITQSGSVLLDALSVERNYLLIKCLFVGGSVERLLPNRFLCEHASSPYPYPVLVSLDDDASLEAFDLLQETNLLILCTQPPCESWYMTLFRTSSCTSTHPILTRVARRLNQSYPILTDSPKSIQTWLSTCRSCLYEHTKGVEKTDLCSGAEVASFLEKALHSYAQPNNKLHKLPMMEDHISSQYQVPLGDEDALGIELTVRYGQRLGLLSYSRSRYLAESEHKIALSSLLRQIRSSLFKQRDTDLASSQHSTMSVGFDWFAATIFLLFNGNVNLSWMFLSEFAADLRSVYIWHTRSQLASCSFSSGVANPFYFNGCHFLDRILALECPDVYSIFLLVELSLSQIFIRWIKQCFWNYLNWSEIVDYLVACILHPAPYCVYVVVAILRHLGESINRAKSEMPTEQEPQPEQMIVFLQEEPIRGFHLSEHMTYINELHRKYGAQLDPIFSNLD